MKTKLLLLRFAVLVTAMMCALGAAAAEAYACYTSSNTTLTFYYDNQRSSRTGTTYDLNTGGNDTGWDTDGTNASVTKVVFDPSFADARPTTTCDWFYRMENLESITGMSYLNTSEVTNMNWMFMRCAKLTNLDVSYFNTSKVTSVTRMFYGCSNLRTIYVGNGWSTAAVATSNNMFSYCTSLVGGQGTTYDENHVDKAYAHIDGGTSNPGYFTRDSNSPEPYACYTPSNTTLTFYYDNQRSSRTGTTYDLNTGGNDTGWDTDGTNASVTKVVFDPSFTGARPTTTYDWFYYMQNLESITGLNYLNTSEVTNMDWMFLGCGKLTSLDFSSFNTSKVTSMYHMFDGCVKLQTIYVGSGWSTAAVTSSSEMFNFCPRLVGGQGTTWDIDNPKDKTYAHIDGGPSNPGYFTEWKEAYACYTPSNTTLTFYYDSQRSSRTGTTYDLNTGNYSPGWYTDGTYSNVSEVKFDPSFTNALPTTCHSWFRDMAQLQTIYGLNYLNTSAVTHMVSMFRGCSSLTVLDLSSFSTANVIAMGGMFMGCSNLRTIYAGSGWSTAAVEASAGMFSNCTSLVGGQGTTYNSSNPKDKTYAHIDGGPSNPGYFTEKGPEAYACYTPSNTTLTFYYDSQRSSRTGTTYDLNEGRYDTGWDTDGTNASVTKVVFDPSFAGARPTTTCDWFYNMKNLQSITGLSYLNTSEVTNMNWMFLNCLALTSLDLSHFNTSKVTDMKQMLSCCSSLTSLDLSSFNTSKVTDMGWMFDGCTNLRTIYVGNGWSTAAVTGSAYMFTDCTSLVGGQGTTYDENHVDKAYAHIDGGPSNPGYFTAKGPEAYACYTSSNTTLTFYYDNQRSSRTGTTYDLNTGDNVTGWQTDGTNASVTKVVFDPSFASARPTSTYGWFNEMENLQSITGIEYLNTSEVTNMGHMFNSCIELTSLDLSNFNTSKVTHMNQMFQFCYELTSLDLSSFNTAKVTDMHFMLDYCTNLRTIYVGNGWSTAAVTNSTNMFRNCTSLVGGQGTTYDANHIDKAYAHIDGGTSNPGYFTEWKEAYACYTPSNTTLTFYYDSQRSSRSGTTYDLNTGSNMPGWYFDGTYASVTKVVFDASFANARPTTTYGWFYYMKSLESITGMSYLNTSEVTTMGWMFWNCIKLTSLDLSHFNTSKVTDMTHMLTNCSKLTSLDVSHFNTSNVVDMGYMFAGCVYLQTIYVGNDWSTAAVTSSNYMFLNCYSLVGGQGTTYNANHIDAAYAHIDGGTSNPGYFTAKAAFLRGDVNDDGYVKIDDVTALINLLLSGNTSAPAADCNQDGKVAIGDVTALINYLLSSTW